MVKDLIKKAKVFKQLFYLREEKVDNIRLILFYDTIQKENYYDDLKQAFLESFNDDDNSKFLYEFQCIYIKSSYLAAGLFNMYEKYNIYSYEKKILQEKVEKMDDENKRLKEDLNELKKKFSKNQDEKKNSLEASELKSQLFETKMKFNGVKNN